MAGWVVGRTHLEIGTIEGAVRINDHEADAPFEDGFVIELRMLLVCRTSNGAVKDVAYLNIDPLLFRKVLVLLHQTLLRGGRHD